MIDALWKYYQRFSVSAFYMLTCFLLLSQNLSAQEDEFTKLDTKNYFSAGALFSIPVVILGITIFPIQKRLSPKMGLERHLVMSSFLEKAHSIFL